MGWSETVNGALLALAEDAFDVLITTDKNLSFQQSLPRFESPLSCCEHDRRVCGICANEYPLFCIACPMRNRASC
jgi:hypothetical protein